MADTTTDLMPEKEAKLSDKSDRGSQETAIAGPATPLEQTTGQLHASEYEPLLSSWRLVFAVFRQAKMWTLSLVAVLTRNTVYALAVFYRSWTSLSFLLLSILLPSNLIRLPMPPGSS